MVAVVNFQLAVNPGRGVRELTMYNEPKSVLKHYNNTFMTGNSITVLIGLYYLCYSINNVLLFCWYPFESKLDTAESTW